MTNSLKTAATTTRVDLPIPLLELLASWRLYTAVSNKDLRRLCIDHAIVTQPCFLRSALSYTY